MKLTTDERTHLRMTLGQMKHEIGVLQQTLEVAPVVVKETSGYSNFNRPDEFEMDGYLIKFRLGNVSDLSMHLLELLKLADSKPK